MEHFEDCGELSIGNQQWLRARVLFDSYAVDESQVRDEVVKLFRETGSAIDPHTAVGVLAGRIHRRSLGGSDGDLWANCSGQVCGPIVRIRCLAGRGANDSRHFRSATLLG